MKKLLLMIIMLCMVINIVGCSNASEVKQLEKEIAGITSEIENKEDDLEDWEEIYQDAYDIYYAPHSKSSAVQQELQRTKEMMDDALKEANALKRDIDLLKMEKDFKEDELTKLNKN